MRKKTLEKKGDMILSFFRAEERCKQCSAGEEPIKGGEGKRRSPRQREKNLISFTAEIRRCRKFYKPKERTADMIGKEKTGVRSLLKKIVKIPKGGETIMSLIRFK